MLDPVKQRWSFFFCENSSVKCRQFRKKAPSHMYKKVVGQPIYYLAFHNSFQIIFTELAETFAVIGKPQNNKSPGKQWYIKSD